MKLELRRFTIDVPDVHDLAGVREDMDILGIHAMAAAQAIANKYQATLTISADPEARASGLVEHFTDFVSSATVTPQP